MEKNIPSFGGEFFFYQGLRLPFPPKMALAAVSSAENVGKK